MTRILGIDCSTTTIGLSVLEYDINVPDNIKLIFAGYYKPDKKNGVLEMLVKAREYIINLAKQYNVDEFAIEQYIQFMKGKSSASTVIPLAVINTTMQLSIFDVFGIKPEILNVLKIRHTLKKSKELPKKEDIPDLVASHLKIDYPWIFKYNKKKKEQVVAIESFDVADSIGVGICSIILKTHPKKAKKSSEPKIKKIKVKQK